MSFKGLLLSLFDKHRGASEIVAAVIVFAVTLTVSSASITFLSQRAGLASSIMLQESKRAMIEHLASVRVVDVLETEDNKAVIVLYNPTDMVIRIVAVIAGDSLQRVNMSLEPADIVDLCVDSSCDIVSNHIYLLTVEGALIEVRP
ncbi:MAG: hypothetical protein QW701_05675 [Candidatus Nezhaarchaeales archaeon]